MDSRAQIMSRRLKLKLVKDLSLSYTRVFLWLRLICNGDLFVREMQP